MTIAELERKTASYKRVKMTEAKEKANYDYILAELIGRSVARVFSKGATYPDIMEVYPSLFEDDKKEFEKQRQEKMAELSALRFRQFAKSYESKRRCKNAK